MQCLDVDWNVIAILEPLISQVMTGGWGWGWLSWIMVTVMAACCLPPDCDFCQSSANTPPVKCSSSIETKISTETVLLFCSQGQDAGFIILDGIRMLCEKMYTLILHFNFYTNIILVFKFIKGILFFLDLNGETRGKNNAL